MKQILFSAMIVAAMASCSKEQEAPAAQSGPKEITVLSTVDGQTKAAIIGTSDITGLQFLSAEGASMPTTWVGKIPFSGNRAGSDGKITMNSKLYYNEDGTTNTYLTSYYPAGVLSNNILTWSIDGKTNILTAAPIDKGNKTTAANNALSYKHQLCQVEVICKVETDGDAAAIKARWGKVTGIKMLDAPAKASLDYSTLLVNPSVEIAALTFLRPDYSTPLAALDLQLSAATDVQAAAMVYPQATRTFQLELAMAGGTEGSINRTVTIDLGEGNTMVRAKKHVVTLTFKKTNESGTEIEVSGTAGDFEEWSNGATGSGSIQ